MYEANLVDLIEAAAAGEEVFIKKNENVSVQLVPQAVKGASVSLAVQKGIGLYYFRRKGVAGK